MPFAADLYYQAYQKGEVEGVPLVLIHGAGGTHLYWPPQARRLAGRQVYSLDLPGHGSSAGDGCVTIDAYASRVRAWLSAIGVKRAVFAGHSMGGAIALTLALDAPTVVLGLALLGTAAQLRVNATLLEKAASRETFLEAVGLVTAWSYSPTTPGTLVALAARRMAESRVEVLYGDFLACDGFDASTRLGEIHLPTRILVGAEDRMVPMRQAQALAEAIPGAQIKVIPNAGHMVMIEQPDAVAASLAEFLQSCQIQPPLV